MPGKKRRETVTAAFGAFHAAVGRALGAADQLQEHAVRRHAETLVELWIRREGLDAVRADPSMTRTLAAPALRERLAEVEESRRRALAGWLPQAAELTRIVGEGAQGPAGAPGRDWLGPPPGDDEAAKGIKGFPQLWRIGSGRLPVGGPFPVAVPLLDESHLRVDSTPSTRAAAETLVEQLVMRVLSTFRPGLVTVDVWDHGQFGMFPALHPLTRTGLLTAHDPNRLGDLLDELSGQIRKVQGRVLVEGYGSLAENARALGERSESWKLVVLAGNRGALPEEDQRRLQRIARSGLACGIVLVLLDVPLTVGAPVETVRFTDSAVRCSMTGPHVVVEPDPPLRRDVVTGVCQELARLHEADRARARSFGDLRAKLGAVATSAAHLVTVIGFDDGKPVELKLDDSAPHALVGGPSGSGKTNLLLALIGSLADRYTPDELHFYLMDFKEGVSFARFAPGRSSDTFLPHARLIGINVNTDREFGLALLQFLADEMRRRAEAAKEAEVTKLEELRAAEELRLGEAAAKGRWPRLVAVIDEFQYLFAENDEVTKQAAVLLEDVARRGRSHGIHLVFASQDVSGIEAFWKRPAILEQFVLRIALPRGRRILANLNDAALTLPRWHAVVNHESGQKHANEIARIPNAAVGPDLDDVQREAHAAYTGPPPHVFDGARAPAVTPLLAGLEAGKPAAVVGQVIDIDGSAAAVELPDIPGRNVAILGSGSRDAMRVLGGIAAGLLLSAPAGARFVVAPLVADGSRLLDVLRSRTDGRIDEVPLPDFRAFVEDLAKDVTARAAGAPRPPVYLLLAGADAADPLLERPGTEALRTVIRFGPEVGVHVLGWWRSAARLRQLLSLSASAEDIGAWVALDVQGSDLIPFWAQAATAWSPRPGRGLFFDRSAHARPRVVLVPAEVVP